MARLIKGDVVVIPFPFSDLSTSKRRPALVISKVTDEEVVLCQITKSNRTSDLYQVSLQQKDFEHGNLDVDSYIRPNRLFTADSNVIIKKVGKITSVKMNDVINKLIEIVKS